MSCITCMLIGGGVGIMLGLVGPLLVTKLKNLINKEL